jgi:hypothetical protein
MLNWFSEPWHGLLVSWAVIVGAFILLLFNMVALGAVIFG